MRPPHHPPNAVASLWTAKGTPSEVRRRVAAKLVSEAPEGSPRSGFAYSNASYIVAGALLERATGRGLRDGLDQGRPR